MNSIENIIKKLNAFIKKYYTQKLLKGIILFVCFGLLVFLLIISLEYFLWLNSSGRFSLLLTLILATVFLLYKLIIVPLFYLFQLKKGLTNKEASILIGKHFSEVDDKLYNLLDLTEDTNSSELLLASIEQRSKDLDGIPFVKAINSSDVIKYLKYVSLPILFFIAIWLSGNLSTFFGSYKRVVNYKMAYEQPAPFSFRLINDNLSILSGESIKLQVVTEGKLKPENVSIVFDGKEMLLQEKNGVFEYKVMSATVSKPFYFLANEVVSKSYNLSVKSVPLLKDFKLRLDYPNYINRKPDILRSTGNATFPEGTKVTWNILGSNINNIVLELDSVSLNFSQKSDEFFASKTIYNDLIYSIKTSNNNVKNYESLEYSFKIIKDAHPTVSVEQIKDSLNPNVSYYVGKASDDYKVKSINLVCYPSDDIEKKQFLSLSTPNNNIVQFYYTFPSGLKLEAEKNYSFYFVVTDNDAIHKGKSSKSQVFSTLIFNDNQLKNNDLNQQQQLLEQLDNSADKLKEQETKLEELNNKQKEKSRLNFNEKNEIIDFLQKQQNQEQMMEKFSKELRENLKKSNKTDKQNKLLQERLERQEIEAKKNQKLLEELNKIAEKINKEELSKRLEELAKSQKSSKRNLEQLLELTKKYYVTEKTTQIAKDLEKLAKKQETLSEQKIGQDYSNSEQEKLNKDFKNIANELKELEKDNSKLKNPLEINSDKTKQESIAKDQNQALDEINKHQDNKQSSASKSKEESGNKASKKQKSAAQKIKEMSQELQQSSSGEGGNSITEDAEMLRQILDNLIVFSFKQESLYNKLDPREMDLSSYSGTVKSQKELRTLFEHVDDSLFALSLRQVELSEFVNEQVTEIYYNIDKSLENIADNRAFIGKSNQKYVLNASNSLADFLVNLLDNMNQSMKPSSGKGQSKGQGFQLPDIIKAQNSLKNKMDKDSNSNSSKGNKSGSGKQGEGTKSGSEGKEGESGKNDKQVGKEKGENNKTGSGQPKSSTDKIDTGSGNQLSEKELEEIYNIYKEQQLIRQQLEQQLQNMINEDDKNLAKKILKQMEEFEDNLLENGITKATKNKVNNIQHQLLKLENAALKQGQKSEREATINKDKFANPIITKPSALDNYRNEIEVLNRQALPLHQIFQNKVQRYFKTND